jgi:dephospho-CoA kinase
VLVIGLTGGIGAGKTEVTHVLRELGAMVIESDRVAHLSYLPGTEAHKAIVSRFGSGVLDESGVIDRSRLGEIVFSNTAQREELEAIVWPATRKWIEARLKEEEKRGTETVVIEVPKLYEAGWDEFVDIVWTVEAPETEIFQRVEQRSGMGESDTEARIAAQLPRPERIDRADTVINNDATLDELRAQISKLWESISKPQSKRDRV